MNWVRDVRVKLRSLLLTALIRVPSTASNSRPNRSSWRHSRTNSRKTWRKALRLSRRKSAMVLKSGFRCRSSQITSILRWGFGLQPAARSHSVQLAVDVKLQQIPRRIWRAARHLRRNAAKPPCREIQLVNKSVNEPYRVVRTDIVIHCLRQKQQLRAVVTSDVRHVELYYVRRRGGIRSIRLFTQSA